MSRNTRRSFYRFTVAVLVITGLAIGYWFVKQFEIVDDREVTFSRYPAFGIELPTDYTIHGIDVSRYQKSINWMMVQKMQVQDVKLGFAFMKATEGIGLVDEQFRRNWRKAKEAGLVRGAYHFFIPSKSGKAQAENFIATVNLAPGDLPPVLDVETLSGASVDELRNNVKEWLETVEDYYGVQPIIYSNAAFYTNYLDQKFSHYPLWVAHYLQRQQPRVNRPWLIWQHNEAGRVNGISTGVDFNAFNGDSAAFKALLIKGG